MRISWHRLLPAHQRIAAFWILSGLGIAGAWMTTGVSWTVAGDAKTCTVSSIYDGDTMRVECAGERLQVRLHCIDAPEMAQAPWGLESRDHLRAITPTTVVLRIRDTDRYGRKVAEVLTGDGASLNQRQVRDGHAAVYLRYCSDPAYLRLQDDAKAEALGIWERSGDQQTPWSYRQAH